MAHEKPDARETARTLMAVALAGGDIQDAHFEVSQVCEAYLSEEPARRAPFYVPIAVVVALMGLGALLSAAAAGIAFYRLGELQEAVAAAPDPDPDPVAPPPTDCSFAALVTAAAVAEECSQALDCRNVWRHPDTCSADCKYHALFGVEGDNLR